MVISAEVAPKIPLSPETEAITQPDNTYSNQILILFSAPLLDENLSPVENLSIHKEVDAIALVLEEISQPLSLEIVVKVATTQTLQDVFSSRVKPLIIHFIGHGTREDVGTALILEDEVGMARSMNEEELAIVLSDQQQAPCQLALLSACHSEKLAQAFVRAGVEHVIAINAEDKILDVAARCFCRRLYQALFNQDEIVNAFLVSRNAVKVDGKLKRFFNAQTLQKGVNFDEAFKFCLLPQTSHNQSLIIEPANSHQIIYPQWSNTNIPQDDPEFVGRRQEIHQSINVFVETDQRCLALHGMGGIGKTALAFAIGRWLHERDRFRDGVWFIGLRDTDSVGNLIIKVKQILELSSFSLERELKNRRVFLILDDLDKLIEKEPDELIDLLNSLLEQCRHLRLLLTSRDSLVREIRYCNQQEVCSMGASETREIFRKYSSEDNWRDDDDFAEYFLLLVNFLDGYPLAIKLAASYLEENAFTLKMLCEELEIEPLGVLESYSPQERKEKSLRVTLELSFKKLSVEAKDIFPWLALFPSGMSQELIDHVLGRRGQKALRELYKLSMAEKSNDTLDWRVELPEPARAYAESKLEIQRGLDYLAPEVLKYYQEKFCDKIIGLFDSGNTNKGRQLLLQESSNLVLFLQWGHEKEVSMEGICHSSRITAKLSPYWRWIEANQDPLTRLNLALTTAQRNQDSVAADLVSKAIENISFQGSFKEVQSLVEDDAKLESFAFETVTVNLRGQIIRRQSKSARYFIENLGNNIILEMAEIPGGKFLMGTENQEVEKLCQKYGLDYFKAEQPQHQVAIQPFYMSKYLITQAQWRIVATLPKIERELDTGPSYFNGENLPVERVSWLDVIEFCARLSQLIGGEYRLPSEAEWEYACRAVTTTPFYFGETITSELANYDANNTFAKEIKGEYRGQTTPVGQFPPNAFGLYDMHGNVWEWCEDDWYQNYEGAPQDGSARIEMKNTVEQKVLRGGSCY